MLPEKNIRISVIIPTHNRSDALKSTLDHLAKQNFDDHWEVIVINNNCTDDTDEIVKKQNFPASLRLVHEKKPGPAAARNTGVKNARGEYILFIDNDILTAPNFVQQHFERLEQNPGCWFIGQVVNLPEQDETSFGRYRKSLFPKIPADAGMTDAVDGTGAGLSMPKNDFEKLGGFDENFFVASGEDRELAMRAQSAGIRILFDPSIVMLHNDWAGSTIRDYCKRQQIYTQTEPFFWQKYGDKTPRLEMVKKNVSPHLKRDGMKLFVWKKMKGILGSDQGQSIVIKICETMENISMPPKILWKFYRLAIAGAIYRGFQEGLSAFSISKQTEMETLEINHESTVG